MKEHFVGKSFFFVGESHTKCFDCSFCRAKEESYTCNKMDIPHSINQIFKNCPIVVNCFYGDPFIDNHQSGVTFNYLDKLSNVGHSGIVVLIVRSNITKDIAKRLSEYNLNIVIGYSYFNSKSFDRVSKSFKIMEQFNIKHFLEFRPIIKNVNNNRKDIENAFILAKNTCIGYSGLMTKGDIINRVKDKYPDMGLFDGQKPDLHKKLLDQETVDLLNEMSEKYGVSIHLKSSCAISTLLNIPDYNAHYYRPNEVGCFDCPNIEICMNHKELNKDTSMLPFQHQVKYVENSKCYMYNICEFPSKDCTNIKGDVIHTDQTMTTSDVRVTKWLTGYTVRPKTMIESHKLSDFWQINKE